MSVEALVQGVVRLLQTPRVSREGRSLTLAEYLDWIDAQPSPPRDEQDVVDTLTRELLEALGYEQAHIAYNKTSEVGRPDYAVSLPHLLRVCLLIVEDKATSVRDLRRKARSGPDGAGVSARPTAPLCARRGGVWPRGAAVQRAGAGAGRCAPSRCRCFGWTCTPSPARRKTATRRRWRASEPLQVLYGRFSRHAFEDTQRQLEQILVQTRLSTEEDALYARVSRQAADKAYHEAQERQWKANAINVAQHPDKLVEALRRLIEELSGDVAISQRCLGRPPRVRQAAGPGAPRRGLGQPLARPPEPPSAL